MTSVRSVVESVGTGCLVVGLVLVGVVTGIDVWKVSLTVGYLTVRIAFVEGLLTLVGFTAFALVSGGFLVEGVWMDRPTDRSVGSGPAVRAIVPAYRDAGVVDVAVERLLDSEYEQLAVSVVVEPNDRPTRERAEELAAEYERVDCLVNGTPGSKASAINHAVRESEAEYFVIADADERIDPEFVPAAVGALLGETDVFQGRRIPRPTGPVETLAYCERVIVHAAYTLFEPMGFANPRSGSTAFTHEAFRRVGGYDRERLTEDLEFAHQCYNADLAVTQDRSCTSTMEPPHTLRDFWGQRKRWRMGQIQVCASRMRNELRGESGYSGIPAVARAAGSILGGILTLVFASHVLLLALLEATAALAVPFVCVLATIAAVWTRDALDGRVGRPSWTLIFVPLIYPLLGILTVKSILEYYLTWNGEWYLVTKVGS